MALTLLFAETPLLKRQFKGDRDRETPKQEPIEVRDLGQFDDVNHQLGFANFSGSRACGKLCP
jgi:hypothetical protein